MTITQNVLARLEVRAIEAAARALRLPMPSPTLSTYRRNKLLVAIVDATLRRAIGAVVGAVATVAAFISLGVL